MSRFIGRVRELKQLQKYANRKVASFLVVMGRRRIGKSRLIEEFSKNFKHHYTFVGLPPEKDVTAQHQLDEFSRQMAREFKTAYARYEDWSDAFWALGERVSSGKILLVFDEISWMGSKDPTFLGKIKNLWDLYLKKNDQIVFIVCGSASSWIDENLLSSTGFVGRVSYTLTLKELPLLDCSQFWPKHISPYEKFKILSITGGIPRYLEEIDPKLTAEENIKNLCFTKGAFLVMEFEKIFSDLFLKDSHLYKEIIRVLVSGAKERQEICEKLGIEAGGRISNYLSELQLAGFISRDRTWNMDTSANSKLSKYRLSDNYMRFYLKYIEKNLTLINQDEEDFHFSSLGTLPEWYTILGLQFENLVLNNRKLIHDALNIKPGEIIFDNPFFQRKHVNKPGCQIDYLIQTKFNTLYVCEIKFSKNKIDNSVIQDIQRKINSLMPLKGFSIRPVLIHVNGLSEEVIESDFFSTIIDFSSFLET